ncbi:hypothetical protein R9C00_07005 [Flammeovirgaceae bacterium SG7u.111]|nr:hypothetical protein [Flammeovirgaceae bacterium SG7u.132]WPO37192.1 hypothetical protein R9C00_07005 [Flammeovirgaceae bacterium SG7u.111]
MKENFIQILLLLTVALLFESCSTNDDIDVQSLIAAPEEILINDEKYTLNGYLLNIENQLDVFAEFVKDNKTDIDSTMKIGHISIVKDNMVYQASSLTKMAPSGAYSLISKSENLPNWVSSTGAQMVVEIKLGDKSFF